MTDLACWTNRKRGAIVTTTRVRTTFDRDMLEIVQR